MAVGAHTRNVLTTHVKHYIHSPYSAVNDRRGQRARRARRALCLLLFKRFLSPADGLLFSFYS